MFLFFFCRDGIKTGEEREEQQLGSEEERSIGKYIQYSVSYFEPPGGTKREQDNASTVERPKGRGYGLGLRLGVRG